MTAIFRREFRSYFTSLIGYVFIAIMLFFELLVFTAIYSSGSTDLPLALSMIPTVMIFTIPVLTMRMLSEDRRLKVDQALLTAPVSVAKIVMGKFFATFTVFAISIAPTFIFQVMIALKVSVNWLVFLNTILGLILLGAVLIAIGMFISSLTESLVISCILTMVIFLLINLIAPSLSSIITAEWAVPVAEYAALFTLYNNFTESVFHVTDVVYFSTLIFVFCFLTVRAVEKRRWA